MKTLVRRLGNLVPFDVIFKVIFKITFLTITWKKILNTNVFKIFIFVFCIEKTKIPGKTLSISKRMKWNTGKYTV